MADQHKILLVIIDGAGYEACKKECGYLEGLVELGQAKRWKMRTALPSISAPLYETIHTGVSPIEHGIACNQSVRASTFPNIFKSTVEAGKKTATVSHSYFFTLYSGENYNSLRHVEYSNDDSPIQRGRFYSMESYCKMNICAPAEIDLCAQTLLLIDDNQPDFLMFHTCSVDSIGHGYGGLSKEYHRQIAMVDEALSRTVPVWLEQGYTVLVTADHGMNESGQHGGTEDIVRSTPFYVIGDLKESPEEDVVLDQCAIAPSVLKLMGIDIPETMKQPSLFE